MNMSKLLKFELIMLMPTLFGIALGQMWIVFAEIAVAAVCIGAIVAARPDVRASVKGFLRRMEASDVRRT